MKSLGKKPIRDLTGQRFTRLTVTGPFGRRGTKVAWNTVCDCGVTGVATSNALRTGNTKSCGCLKALAGKHLVTHGLTATRSHGIWKAAKQRCFNANAHNYKHYGGRGITMCARWCDSFQAFFDDMGECPPGLSLERIDNEGNYEPGNCRWATQAEQVQNTRRAIRRRADLQTRVPA